VRIFPSKRERQVRRALAAERARRRRTVDAEIAAVRHWLKRAIPAAAAANLLFIPFSIYLGAPEAMIAPIALLPNLAISYVLLLHAEQRDAPPRARSAIALLDDDAEAELASWIRALDVELAAGAITAEKYDAERKRYEKLYGQFPAPGPPGPPGAGVPGVRIAINNHEVKAWSAGGWDCYAQGHLFLMGDSACQMCGVSAPPVPETRADWFRGVPDPDDDPFKKHDDPDIPF